MLGSDLSYLPLRFFRHLANSHPKRNVFPFSQDFHLYLSIDLRARNHQGKIVGLFDLLSIVFCDDIADLYPAGSVDGAQLVGHTNYYKPVTLP